MTTLTPFDRLLNTLTIIISPILAAFTQEYGTRRRPPVNGVIPTALPEVTAEPLPPAAPVTPEVVAELPAVTVEVQAVPAQEVAAPVLQAERVDTTGLELYVRVMKGTKAKYEPAPAGRTEGVYTKRTTKGGQTRYDLINPRWTA